MLNMRVYHTICDECNWPGLHKHSCKVKLSMKIIQQYFFHKVLITQQQVLFSSSVQRLFSWAQAECQH